MDLKMKAHSGKRSAHNLTHWFLAKVISAVHPRPEADEHVTGSLLAGTSGQMKRSLFLLKYFKERCN